MRYDLPLEPCWHVNSGDSCDPVHLHIPAPPVAGYALLAGSIGLFLLLALTMYLTRNFANLAALSLSKADK